MFIVLEGIDGCGKSTQAKRLAARLRENGRQVVLTSEPTKGKIGLFIREILSGKEKVDAKTLALLFTADRCEHLGCVVIPAISDGKVVVSERYYHSTIAYQSAQDVDSKWLLDLNRFALKPDLTLFLDVKPACAMERKEGREIFEEKEFLEKVYSEYLRFSDVVRIDGSGSPDDVSGRINKAVSDML